MNEPDLRLYVEDVQVLVETRWERGVPGRCLPFWFPGFYGGYVVAPKGASYRGASVVVGEENQEGAAFEPYSLYSLVTVGAAWTPSPYIAVTVGLNILKLSESATSTSKTVYQPMIGFGGSLDIFTKLFGK